MATTRANGPAAALARPGNLLDLRSLNPAARFAQLQGGEPLVLIDAVTRGDPQQLKAALLSLGLRHPSVYSNDVSGWLPLTNIDAAAARAEVVSMRAAMSHARVGAVTSQGDFAQGSATARTTWPGLDGSGITVGVLSDSFNCYAVYQQPGSGVPVSGGTGYAPNGITTDAQKDTSTGDLPASVNVLEEAGHRIELFHRADELLQIFEPPRRLGRTLDGAHQASLLERGFLGVGAGPAGRAFELGRQRRGVGEQQRRLAQV